MIQVVAVALIYQNSVLVAKRKPRPDFGNNRWEFPGGKVESGEDHLSALKREIFEELEIRIQNPQFLMSTRIDDRIEIHFYMDFILDQRWTLNAHEEVKWVHWKDINQFEFLDSNHKFVSCLQDWFINQGFK